MLKGFEAKYYNKEEDGLIHCVLCPHNCRIPKDKRGICGVRHNKDGTLYAESYGQVSSLALDPIEKKPLYNFLPGSLILSVGSYGCNFACSFCQNHHISMDKPETAYIPPEKLAYKAAEIKNHNNIGIAYTYNEPLMNYEYILDCSRIVKEMGLKNVVVTNGYIQEAPLKELLPYIDAMNIDLKSFNQDFYQKICKGRVEFVKKTIEAAIKECHVEITCLIIPGLNDSVDEMEALSSWLSSLSREIPLHLTRFFPRYKMLNKGPTPISTMEELAKRANKHLKYVYLGNV